MNEKNSEKKLAISQKSSADLNVPLSDIAQLHISSLSTPSKADNDSKASSALKENAKFEYKKGVIEFWDNERNNEIENLDIGTDEKSAYGIPYWQSVFEIKQIEKLDGVHIRKMCIYTKKPLSKLPALEFVYDNMLFNVLVRSAKNPTYFKDESDQLLLKYTIALTKRLTNKDYTCTQENAPYFILPLETAVSESVFQEKIDWQEIERTVANDTKQRIPLHNSKLTDKLVFKPNNENKLFFVKYTQTDSSLQGDISIINEEQNTLAKDSKNQSETVKQGPLIQAFALTKETRQFIKNKNKMDVGPETKSTVWLKPEEHRIFPISASVYQASQLIPDILLQIDAFLLIQQLKTVHNLQFIDDVLMLEAFTSPSANRKQDYERLEFLGDAVLKFIVSSYLYAKYPAYSEAELTCLRQVMTSNKSFASNAKDLKLHRYIISQSTVRRFWRPPHFQNALDSNKIKHWLTHHLVSDNTLADIIESTVGAAFLSQSIDGAVYAATQLKLPLESIKVWSDLRHIWTSSPASATGQINIDVVRVGEMLGYQFKNYLLVQEALTHGSVMDSLVPCYERLEFLGDAILDFFVTQYIYQKHPTAAPGVLHNLRKSSVNHHILSAICLNMGLDKHIIHVSAEIAASILKAETIHKDMQSKGKDTDEYWLHFNPPKVLSDVIESLMGAILVDSEFDINQVEEFFERWFKPILEKHISVETMAVHPMSQLNTLVQNLGCINWTIQ